MQLLADQSSLASALQVVCRIVPKRPVTPVVSSVLIRAGGDAVQLHGTDLQSYVEVTIAARVHVSGEVAVDARFLQRVVATLGNTEVALSLSDSGESLRITAGPAAFRLRTLDGSDFPLQSVPGARDVEMETAALVDLVARTTFCAADSDDVSPFAGVLIAADASELTMAATDSYQLAHYRLPTTSDLTPSTKRHEDGTMEAVVPTNGLTSLTRALTLLGDDKVDLVWHERSLWFASGAIRWRMRRLDLQYPNLSRFTGPLTGIRIDADRSAMLEAVRQVSSIADEARAVGLRVDGDRLHVFTSHREVGEAQSVVTLTGDHPRCEVWIDAERLARALRAQPEESIALYVSEPLAPVAIVPASGGSMYRTVLMPLRHYAAEADAV